MGKYLRGVLIFRCKWGMGIHRAGTGKAAQVLYFLGRVLMEDARADVKVAIILIALATGRADSPVNFEYGEGVCKAVTFKKLCFLPKNL